MATELSLNSYDQFMALLRETNDLTPLQLTANDVDLQNLEAISDAPSGKNTSLIVASKENRRYTGNVLVEYNRLQVGGLTQYGTLTIVINEGDGEAQILAAINTAYGSNLSFDDVTLSGAELVDFDGEFVTITAKVTSLAWLGSLELLVKWTQTALNSILVINELNGLRWPAILGPLLIGTVSTYRTYSTTLNLHSTCIDGDYLYIAGGCLSTSVGQPITTFVRINLLTNQLETLPSLPNARSTGTLEAASNGKIYYIGGRTSSTSSGSVYEYTAGSGWVTKASIPSSARKYQTAAVKYGDLVYLFGGFEGIILNTVHSYNMITDEWIQHPNLPFTLRFASACVKDNVILIIGGYRDGAASASVNVFNPLTNTLDGEIAPLPSVRQYHGSCSFGGRIYVMGGQGIDANAAKTDLLYLNDEDNQWYVITTNLGFTVVNFGLAAHVNGLFSVCGRNSNAVGTVSNLIRSIV